MKLTVAEAREFAKVLNAAADKAEAKGIDAIDLGESLEANAAAALAELQSAIDSSN